MTAIRDQLFANVVAALEMTGDVTEEMPSGDPDVFPNLAAYDRGQRVIEYQTDVNLYALALEVEGYVEGEDGPDARAALNALYTRTIRALTADETFGGLAQSFSEGDMRVGVAQLADRRSLGFVLDCEVQFFASRIDPAVL